MGEQCDESRAAAITIIRCIPDDEYNQYTLLCSNYQQTGAIIRATATTTAERQAAES